MSEPRAEKYLLIRLALDVHDAIVRAARGRHTTKTEFIERLLTVIVKDSLIDALLDDRDRRRLSSTKGKPRRPNLSSESDDLG